MKRSGLGGIIAIAGMLLCILAACASAPEIPEPEIPVIAKPFWETILDDIPWENRISGNVAADVHTLPDDLFSVMIRYGYRYVNATYKIRQEDALGIIDNIYELKREDASYDESDDTFMFVGEFYPDEENIWLIFSKESDYALFAEPDELNKKDYRFIKISGTAEQD
ncbi:hypothetical protein FACS1894141_5990 [Spirochaetia bacterium]|nr:hypothetical protein FACS1894141_5990 [Spirochaetia bacterium]